MKFEFEYGQGTMAANLPDNTDVFIPGETVKDPACIPEDQLEAAYFREPGSSDWHANFNRVSTQRKHRYHRCSGPCKRRRAANQP